MTATLTLGFRLKTRLNLELLLVGLVVVLAVATRLYQLATFPSFPPQWPWLGDGPQYVGATNLYPGLYRDEASRLFEIAVFPRLISAYEPSMNIVFVKVAQILLGQNYFADRLPTALASALTALVIYLTAKQLFKSTGASLISGLYFAIMVPAIIYGRMIFYENIVGLFLAGTIYCIAKFENSGERRWLYLGALSAALAPFGKVDGAFVPIFFTVWAVTGKESRAKLIPLIVAWSPVAIGVMILLVLKGSLPGLLLQWNAAYVGKELSLQFLAIQSLPSGSAIFAGGFVKPEFWYIFGYICLAALIIKGVGAGRILMQGLFSFVIVMLAVWGMSPYYLIMIYPVIALSAGGGMPLLARLNSSGALAMFAGLYSPLVATYIASSSLPNIETNPMLYAIKLGLVITPLVVWLITRSVFRLKTRVDVPLAPVILVCFFALLVLGTPTLYSSYFFGTSP